MPHPDNRPHTPVEAAAHLHRLAQAERLLRLYREAHDANAPTAAAVSAWVAEAKPARGEPTHADYHRVRAANPGLAALADLYQPGPGLKG